MGPVERQQLRQRTLGCRDETAESTRRTWSRSITEKLWRVEDFVGAATVLIYVAFRSEVETMPLLWQCLEKGKRVAVPLTDPESMELRPFAITAPENDLAPGLYGILEPVSERVVAVKPAEIDAVILPGSVFDLRGGRLGYGGGCYDRFLDHDAPLARRIGLAYELQVVDRVPVLPHDKPLHVLVTEKRIMRFNEELPG